MGIFDMTWEEVAGYLEGIRRRRPTLREVVDLQGRILRVQHAAALALPAPSLDPVAEGLAGRNSRGLPLLPREEFALDWAAAANVFGALLVALAEVGGAGEARVGPIRRALEAGTLDPAGLVRRVARGEVGDPAGGLDEEQLRFLAGASLRPCAESLGRALGQWVEGDRWYRPLCPVCGSPPKVAELRGPELGASRYLHCGFCGWGWPYRRSGCPFCGTADHRAMELLLIEDDPRVKIEGCKACRRYLKVADNKEFFGLVPWLEEITSPHLDLVALERGYR